MLVKVRDQEGRTALSQNNYTFAIHLCGHKQYSFFFFFVFFVVVAISWAAPAAYGGSHARG